MLMFQPTGDKRLCLFLCASIALLLNACANAPKRKVGPGNDLSLQRLTESANARTKASGVGSVVWKSGKRSIGAKGVMVIEWPSRLRLEVQDPLGGMLAFLVMNDQQFWSYREEQGVAYTGNFSAKDWARVLPLPLNANDSLRILLARPPLDEGEVEYLGVENRIRLSYPNSRREDLLAWDPALEQPLLWQIKWPNGATVDAQYDDYKSFGSQKYPTKIHVRYASGGIERLTLIWRWRDLETYLPKVGGLFEIPPDWGKGVRTRVLK